MVSRQEKLFSHILLVFLRIYGDHWLEEEGAFRQHVTFSCRKYSIDEGDFYLWLNAVVIHFIRDYLREA